MESGGEWMIEWGRESGGSAYIKWREKERGEESVYQSFIFLFVELLGVIVVGGVPIPFAFFFRGK